MILSVTKKVAIYPYNIEILSFVRYLNKLNPYLFITDLVSPKGWGYSGKDASFVNLTPDIGIKVTDDINQALIKCDILLISEYMQNDKIYLKILHCIESAINMKKDIICTINLIENDLNSILKSCEASNIQFIYCPKNVKANRYDKDQNQTLKKDYSYTKAPVIFISEMYNGLDSLEVLFAATCFFREKGYKTVSISEKQYGDLLNIYTLPNFMQNSGMIDSEKVYRLNKFVKEIEDDENPDIIFLQLPGGIMKYNDKIDNDFGILPYLISQSVQGDYMILCTQYDHNDNKFYRKINEVILHRFGVGLESIHMSNTTIDINGVNHTGKLSVMHMKQAVVNQEILSSKHGMEIPIFNCYNSIDRNNMFCHLIDTLSEYGLAKNIM